MRRLRPTFPARSLSCCNRLTSKRPMAAWAMIPEMPLFPRRTSTSSPILCVSFLKFQSLIRKNAARDVRKVGSIGGDASEREKLHANAVLACLKETAKQLEVGGQ